MDKLFLFVLKFIISRKANKTLDRFAYKTLSKLLYLEVKRWANKLPRNARLYPDSIFINPFDPIQQNDGISIVELKQQIYDAKLPSQISWFNALTERYRYISKTNIEPQNFYKLNEYEAEFFLNGLATKLYKTCLRDEKLLKTNLISRIYGNEFITHEALDNHLMRVNAKQIESNKKTAKYIPEVFVENHGAKEKCRFFLYPSFFWKKFLWNIKGLNFSHLNYLFELVGIKAFEINLPQEDYEDLSLYNSKNIINSIYIILNDKRNFLEELGNETKYDNIKNIVKPDKFELAKEILYHIRGSARRNGDNLLKIILQLEAIEKRVILITSIAGKGKTNFLCDLVENVIFKRSIPAIFFNAKDMEHDLDDLVGFFLKKALPIKFEKTKDCFEILREFCQKENHRFTVIIDGLNEVNNTAKFSKKLEEFVSELLTHDFIKIILSCRSEYIEYRFNNIKSKFEENLINIEGLELSDCDKDIMLKKYQQFFNISANFYGNAYYMLTTDPLMLRFYCETYGNPTCEEVKDLGAVNNINKTELFQNYLDNKIESILLIDCQGKGVPVGYKQKYIDALKNITAHMINNQCYTNIRIENIDKAHHSIINRLLEEDLLLRKDVIREPNLFNRYSDVLNFTYDEFRDNLIASYLINEIWPNDRDKFKKFTKSLIKESKQNFGDETRTFYEPNMIAEGVGRFVIQIAKQNGIGEIENIFKEEFWYEHVRLDVIFLLEEKFISENDVNYVKDCFKAGIIYSSRIIWELWHRKNKTQFNKLNMDTLHSILRDLTPNQYSVLVNPVFENYTQDLYMAKSKNHFTWNIEKLAKAFNKHLRELSQDNNVEIFEFLIFLFCVPSRNYNSPALDVYDKFTDTFPENAIKQLVNNYRINNMNILLHITKRLIRLNKKGYSIIELKEIIQHVTDRLMHIDEKEYNRDSMFWRYAPVLKELWETDKSVFTNSQVPFVEELISSHSINNTIKMKWFE